MTTYCRLNDPVAYGDIDESDEVLLERARENLTVEGLDDKYLDFQVEDHPKHGDKTVHLFTLFEKRDGDRVNNGAQNESHTPATECGDREYFDHVWESYSVEGVHVYEE